MTANKDFLIKDNPFLTEDLFDELVEILQIDKEYGQEFHAILFCQAHDLALTTTCITWRLHNGVKQSVETVIEQIPQDAYGG